MKLYLLILLFCLCGALFGGFIVMYPLRLMLIAIYDVELFSKFGISIYVITLLTGYTLIIGLMGLFAVAFLKVGDPLMP